MSSEIFRFVTVRPPRPVDASQAPISIDLNIPSSKLALQLRNMRSTATRAEMVAFASNFVNSTGFYGSSANLPINLFAFVSQAIVLSDSGFWAAAQGVFNNTIGGNAGDYVKGGDFTTAYASLSDSILAATLTDTVTPATRTLISNAIRSLWLIRCMADGSQIARTTWANAPFVMPPGIFPLPSADPSLTAQRTSRAEANAAALAARQKQMAGDASQLSEIRNAVQELLATFQVSSALRQTIPTAKKTPTRIRSSTATSGFLLSDSATARLSRGTKAAIGSIGVSTTGGLDIAKTVMLLEAQATHLASQLYSNRASSDVLVRVGQNLVLNGALLGEYNSVPGDPAPLPTPGPCPPQVDTSVPTGGVTIPTGHGDARILGVADLLVLEQSLARYELGEISHIENVLQSENRSRLFITRDSTQQTDTTQTETDQTKERDLSTDQRFQLQVESQTVISQNDSKAAGLTIHASYGPSVDATASYNTTSSTSTQQSSQTASSYAQEITNKAVDRVQTKTLTSRTITTQHLVKEVDRHAFNNTAGTSDIVGVYRYVNKVYSAQIVNYGKRLMLEFIVPEPAAFLRYALANKPIDTVTLTNPDPPGSCLGDGVTFQPLQVSDITRDYYLYWAGKYGAQDVVPPPASVIIASGVKKAPDSMPKDGDKFLSSDTFDITIPEGYLTQNAFVNLYGETQQGPHQIVFQIQKQQGVYIEPFDDLNNLYDLLPAPALSITVNSNGFWNYEVLATVLCTLSPESFQAWQLKTFASIMNAYEDQKSAYDQAVQEAKLQMSDPTIVGGPNPEDNRITEQIELKKGCISLLTAQRFDVFDAVAPNIAPYGYPEIDFAQAKAEGAYIAAFEQGFEWNNMIYLFYPYFWSNKKGWPTLVQLADPDPVFRQFLQAGAARVQVPVRPGFEAAVLTYLSTAELWNADGTLVNSDGSGPDPQYLSIIDELKSQTGNNNVDGVGTLSVTNASADLVGDGTNFTDDDQDRRIVIAGVTYVIKSVAGPQMITLTTPYSGVTATGVRYASGGKLVGQPWDIVMPTELVKLDNSLVFS